MAGFETREFLLYRVKAKNEPDSMYVLKTPDDYRKDTSALTLDGGEGSGKNGLVMKCLENGVVIEPTDVVTTIPAPRQYNLKTGENVSDAPLTLDTIGDFRRLYFARKNEVGRALGRAFRNIAGVMEKDVAENPVSEQKIPN